MMYRERQGSLKAADRLFASNNEKSIEGLFDNAFLRTHQPSLKLEALKSEGIRVMSNGSTEFNLVLPSNITSSKAFALISKMNPDIVVNYTDDLESMAEELVNKPEKPIWGFETEGNNIKLKRMFI